MSRFVESACQACGKTFRREAREVARSKRLGRQIYCSRTCCGHRVAQNLPSYSPSSTYQIAKHAANKVDEYTGFREHLRRCRRRGHEVRITLEDLRLQWETQQGKCPYTGLELVQPSYQARNDVLRTASLDRIDSIQGYVAGNIQFVSMAMNFAKSTLSHQQALMLCHIIARHWQTSTEYSSADTVQ